MNLYYSIYQNYINPFLYIYSSENILEYCCWIIKKSYIKILIKNVKLQKWTFFENQLNNYFNKKNKIITIALKNYNYNFFTKSVINEISKIKYGETLTYNDIANNLNKPHSNQAVGQACKKNNFPIIIPCHRVVSKTGYGGYMGNNKNNELYIKKELLKLEGVIL